MEPLVRRALIGFCGLLLGCGVLSANPQPLTSQLLSPGPLVEAHAELEGALNCTQCHQLRQRGASQAKCLSCHAPLRARIDRGRGLHGQTDVSDCGSCHTDHAGRDADILRFDAASFRHADAGFLLEGAHVELDCVASHTSERIVDRAVRSQKARGGTLARTYLGLAASCRGCHRIEDPHEDQFGVDSCENCHTNSTWSDLTPFDHAQTAYPLTGQHQQADCVGCHKESNFRGLEVGGCASCHGDPHRRAFGTECTTCHTTAGWAGVSTGRVETQFNHRATGFVLNGAHANADCASCHTVQGEADQAGLGRNIQWAGTSSTGYAPPVVDRGCLSCHNDYHEGDLAAAQDGPDCRGCHTERSWNPAAFDFLMHERTEFPLRGAHQAVVCEACHTNAEPSALTGSRIVFNVDWSDCASCHQDVDPHRGQFGAADCAQCHGVDGFDVTEFDHSTTSFPLDDTHRLPCTSCHVEERDPQGTFVRYTPLGSECADCHSG